MADTSKKQSFLHGTALLAMATAIVKVIGAVYKIPLNQIIGEQGFAYFNTAYDIYNVLLMICTAGLPVAMSRMISQASSLGNYNQVRRVFNTCRAIFLALGITGSLVMVLFAKELANFQQQPNAWFAIACLGPSALFMCLMSTYRGFFQGQGNMLPTSISQVLEASCKLLIGISAAIVLLQVTKEIPMAAGGAILGVTVSCLVSVFFLWSHFRKAYSKMPKTNEAVSSYGSTAKQLLAIAIPITIGSAGLSILNMMETKLYMGQLLGLGYAQSQADTMKGIYDMCKTIFNMPVAFITPITISIIPAITAHLTLKNSRGARATAESAVRVMALIAMPCAFGLIALAEPVTALLGGYSEEKLALSTTLMTILGMNVVFNALVMLTNALMQSHGHVNLPVINMLIGGILKVAAVYLLTGNPSIHIVGTPIGAVLSSATISLLNVATMRRCIPNSPSVVTNMLRAGLSALIMGLCAYGTWYVLDTGLHISSRLILCGLPILVGVAVYALAAIKLKAITREDCLLLPKGEKIAKLLHL